MGVLGSWRRRSQDRRRRTGPVRPDRRRGREHERHDRRRVLPRPARKRPAASGRRAGVAHGAGRRSRHDAPGGMPRSPRPRPAPAARSSALHHRPSPRRPPPAAGRVHAVAHFRRPSDRRLASRPASTGSRRPAHSGSRPSSHASFLRRWTRSSASSRRDLDRARGPGRAAARRSRSPLPPRIGGPGAPSSPSPSDLLARPTRSPASSTAGASSASSSARSVRARRMTTRHGG